MCVCEKEREIETGDEYVCVCGREGVVCVCVRQEEGCSGEVHGPQSVVVNLHGLSQSLGVPAVALSRHMAALPTTQDTETPEFKGHDTYTPPRRTHTRPYGRSATVSTQ